MEAQLTPEVSVSLAGAADLKGVAPKTVRRWIAEGRLPAERVGPRLIRIKVADLDALGEEVKPTPPPDPIREAALKIVAEAPRLDARTLERICNLLRGAA